MILNILIVVVLLYLLVQIWQTLSLFKYQVYSHYKNYVGEKDQWNLISNDLPEISIWVACRNEEKNIVKCLESLVNLNYPQEKIQILVGNDQSTDKTKDLVLKFIDSYSATTSEYNEKKAHLQLVDIVDDDSGLKAKARVMAQLDKFATGNYYLITDADVEVNPNWALGLLGSLSSDMGVASGTTMVKSDGVWGWLQEIDWAYFMGLLNLISFSGIPATAVKIERDINEYFHPMLFLM
jgi:cellulose synthase/poly-beta-1,6-N-acetylglucosamine synthase-like glycosyltransferase